MNVLDELSASTGKVHCVQDVPPFVLFNILLILAPLVEIVLAIAAYKIFELFGAQANSILPLAPALGHGLAVLHSDHTPAVDLFHNLPLKLKLRLGAVPVISRNPKLAYNVPSAANSKSATDFSAIPAVPLPAITDQLIPLSVLCITPLALVAA